MTADFVRSHLDYDPQSGRLSWKERIVRPTCVGTDTSFNVRFAGKNVGCIHHRGYMQFTFYRHSYLLHRVVWLWVHGTWPDGDLDHINMDRADNRIANLRLATKAQNRANTIKYRNTKSGFRGVEEYRAGMWRARITVSGHQLHLGIFDRPEHAAAAYRKAAVAIFGEYMRLP